MSDFDRDESGWRRGINNATCTASRLVGAIDRSGSDPTVHGQWVDADLLGKLPLVEPGVPELTNELIDLGLIATPARALDVMHPSLSPGSKQIGNHGVHRTLTAKRTPQDRQNAWYAADSVSTFPDGVFATVGKHDVRIVSVPDDQV